jgi:tetratricopeptide (TPR) repeat protein
VFCLLLSVGSAGSAVAQDPEPFTPEVWTRAVDAYVDGRYTEAGLSVVRLDPASAQGVVRVTGDSWLDEATPHGARRLKAAAALCFELALAHGSTGDAPAPRALLNAAREAIRRLDAGQRRQRGASAADAAWQSDGFGAIWRLNHLQYLLLTRQLPDVERAAQASDVALLPAPLLPEWHVTRGAGREAISRLWLEPDSRGAMPSFVGSVALSRTQWIEGALDQAARHYRDALAVDPDHAEAHLRLGRVLFERRRPEEARTHLERAASTPCRDAVCGFAWLFLGELFSEQNDVGQARNAYLAASGVLEVRQSALVGMLRVSLRDAPAVALGITRQFDADAMLAQQQAGDGWSRYLVGHTLRLHVFIDALRAEVHR